MPLLPSERKLFFSTFLGILSYVNDKYRLIPTFGHPKNPEGLPLENVVTIKKKLWDNVKIIDEYLDSIKNTASEEQKQILKEWKKKISGRFIIIKHTKQNSIFLDDTNDLLYGVVGITDSISYMIPDVMLPIMTNAVLLPFKKIIIYDGLLNPLNVQLDSNIRKSIKEKYMEIRKEKGIVTTID
ncbi:MAG: hypothetical protein LBC68_02270 [Prevotellaceae bacterium]|jgi:hypothetical protein|nr:hypothetical protein [Prevotellaceae bacterium]